MPVESLANRSPISVASVGPVSPFIMDGPRSSPSPKINAVEERPHGQQRRRGPTHVSLHEMAKYATFSPPELVRKESIRYDDEDDDDDECSRWSSSDASSRGKDTPPRPPRRQQPSPPQQQVQLPCDTNLPIRCQPRPYYSVGTASHHDQRLNRPTQQQQQPRPPRREMPIKKSKATTKHTSLVTTTSSTQPPSRGALLLLLNASAAKKNGNASCEKVRRWNVPAGRIRRVFAPFA